MSLWLRSLVGGEPERGACARRMLELGWRVRDVAEDSIALRSDSGSVAWIDLSVDERAVLSDWAQSLGHPDADRLLVSCQRDSL